MSLLKRIELAQLERKDPYAAARAREAGQTASAFDRTATQSLEGKRVSISLENARSFIDHVKKNPTENLEVAKRYAAVLGEVAAAHPAMAHEAEAVLRNSVRRVENYARNVIPLFDARQF